jgi:hypothetical protein
LFLPPWIHDQLIVALSINCISTVELLVVLPAFMSLSGKKRLFRTMHISLIRAWGMTYGILGWKLLQCGKVVSACMVVVNGSYDNLSYGTSFVNKDALEPSK